MMKWRNFEILCNMCSCLCTVLADSVLYFKKKHWNRLRENSKIRHFVTSFLLTCQPQKSRRPSIYRTWWCLISWQKKKDGLLTHFLIYCQTFLINPFWLWRDWRHWKRPKDSNRLPNRSVHKPMGTVKNFWASGA